MTLNLQPEELTILDLKYKSNPVCKMSAPELTVWSKAAILKIHVITGWTVPANELLNVLIDQFQKKMIESYPTINPDELEYAFRTYGTTVKDWGKQMNLSLVDEVLIPFMAARLSVSQIEEQAKPLLIKGPKEELSDVTMRDWMEDVKGKKLAVEFMPVMIYDWLEKKGELVKSVAEKHEYLQNAVEHRQCRLAQACEENNCQDNRDALRAFMTMKEAGEFTGPEVNTLKSLAKKMILFDYLYANPSIHKQ